VKYKNEIFWTKGKFCGITKRDKTNREEQKREKKDFNNYCSSLHKYGFGSLRGK
jgi:hypothetical protein